MEIEVEELTGINDIDRRAVNDQDVERHRWCSCGNHMVITIGLDEYDKLKSISCVKGVFLREGGNEFVMANNRWDRSSKFIYCRGCRKRRAWNMFLETASAT